MVSRREFSELTRVQIPAALPTAIKDVQDVIIIFTKSMQLGAMLQSIKPLIGEKRRSFVY